MMYATIGAIAFAVGAFFGVALMCCFFVASEADRQSEKTKKPKISEPER